MKLNVYNTSSQPLTISLEWIFILFFLKMELHFLHFELSVEVAMATTSHYSDTY